MQVNESICKIMKVNYLAIRIHDGPQSTVDRESVDIYTANERSCLQPRTSESIVSLAKTQVGHLSVTDESIRILSTKLMNRFRAACP